jgi:Domain of unknown function (DUF4279)
MIVSFSLTGDHDFDPVALSERTGLTPTRHWVKGDSASNDRIRQWSYWCLRLQDASHLEDAEEDVRLIERLIDIILPYRAEFFAAPATAQVGIYSEEDTFQGISMSSTVIGKIAGLGASLDIGHA